MTDLGGSSEGAQERRESGADLIRGGRSYCSLVGKDRNVRVGAAQLALVWGLMEREPGPETPLRSQLAGGSLVVTRRGSGPAEWQQD